MTDNQLQCNYEGAFAGRGKGVKEEGWRAVRVR